MDTDTFWMRLKKIGPALVLAAVVLGPGSITLSTNAGSAYGYGLLWVPVMTTIFMITYTWMAARIGLITRQTLFEVTRKQYGKTLSVLGGITGFLAILAFQASNSAALGMCGELLLGMDPRLTALILFFPALGLIFLPNLYRKLEFLVKLVVGAMVFAFVGTLFTVGVDFSAMLGGFVPRFPESDGINTPPLLLALGIAATTFSIAAAAYQTHLMREKDWSSEDINTASMDTLFGIGILGGVSIIILLTSAGIMRAQGETGFRLVDMANILEPFAGPAAFYLFMFGFFFAAFSSTVVNPLIGATLLVDGLGKDAAMDHKPVKIWTTVAMTAGLLVVLIFGGQPTEVLRIAQALSVVAFPILGFLIFALARNKELMGKYATPLWVQGIAALGYLTLLGIVLNNVREILGL